MGTLQLISCDLVRLLVFMRDLLLLNGHKIGIGIRSSNFMFFFVCKWLLNMRCCWADGAFCECRSYAEEDTWS